MKLILSEYLRSLKERQELDAILPDLLSELGFHVYSRPKIGTTQHGVDIAATGEEDGEKKVFLFSVKQGDLTRQDWDGAANQSLRPSLNQIRDVYIRTKVPQRFKDLKVVICLCFGGDIQENIRLEVEGYIAENTTERISFQEWNGDKLAELLMKGVLREKTLPADAQKEFRKAVAMVDQPDVAFHHFERLVRSLLGAQEPKKRASAARQLYVALWVLYVWARDADNLEAPYRASELAILTAWELLRPEVGRRATAHTKAIDAVFVQLVQLHLEIAGRFLGGKVFPYLDTPQGLASSIRSHSALDINLAMFELLGRIGMLAAWAEWLGVRLGLDEDVVRKQVADFHGKAVKLIGNNPTLWLARHDRQAIDIAIVLILVFKTGGHIDEVAAWLERMTERLVYSVRSHGAYPIVSPDYGDLAAHPRERSDEYRKEVTAGSTMIPLLGAWLTALELSESIAALDRLVAEELPHCTLQSWIPDAASEEGLYVGVDDHGLAITGLSATGPDLLRRLAEATRIETACESLSAMITGNWPVVLLACRHHGLPVPPQFWIHQLIPPLPSNPESPPDDLGNVT